MEKIKTEIANLEFQKFKKLQDLQELMQGRVSDEPRMCEAHHALGREKFEETKKNVRSLLEKLRSQIFPLPELGNPEKICIADSMLLPLCPSCRIPLEKRKIQYRGYRGICIRVQTEFPRCPSRWERKPGRPQAAGMEKNLCTLTEFNSITRSTTNFEGLLERSNIIMERLLTPDESRWDDNEMKVHPLEVDMDLGN